MARNSPRRRGRSRSGSHRRQVAVVGCGDCDTLWLVKRLRATESVECPSCGRKHQSANLKPLAQADTISKARELRARILAERAGELDRYRESGTFAEQDQDIDLRPWGSDQLADQVDAKPIGSDRFAEFVEDRPTESERFAEFVEDRPTESDRFSILAEHHFDTHHLPAASWSGRDAPEVDTPEPPENAGISVLNPGQQPVSDVVSGVGPRYSEWLPDLLEALLPAAAGTVDRLARAEDETPTSLLGSDVGSADVQDDERPPLTGFEERFGVIGAGGRWTPSLVTWMDRWWSADVAESERTAYEKTMDVLTGTGTGQAPEDMGLDAMERTYVRLLSHAADAPTVRVVLDGPSWTDLEDRRTGERALDVLTTLGEVADLRLQMSPRLVDDLRRRFPDWCDEHLSDGRDGSRRPTRTSDAESEYLTLRQWGAQTGRVRLLSWLPADDSRTVKAVKDAATADILPFSPNSVDAYVSDLESEGFVDVEVRTAESNVVTTTDSGRAAQGLITDDCGISDPNQMALDSESYRPPSDSRKESVTRRTDTGGAPSGLSAEEWMAATGTAEDAPSPVRWLDGDGCDLDAWTMHRRLKAGKAVEGVTCVDEDLAEFDDGRVVYLSAFEDHVQVIPQWGNAGPTMIRIAKALSSRLMWDRVLDEETVGRDLGNLVGMGGLTKDDLADALQRGLQIPLKKENLDYESLRSKLMYKGGALLKKIDLLKEGDESEVSKLYRDTLGLFTCMTTILHHVGVDTTVHTRVPDVEMLKADENRYRGFLNFFRHIVPKQTVYGVHSAWRHVGETREEKLKFRLPVEVDPQEASAEMTCSFVVSGPGANELAPDLRATLQDVEVREAVRDGAEETMHLSIPVVDGSSFSSIRDVVEDIACWKGYSPRDEELRRATRVFMGVLGREKWSASPYAVAEAMLGLAKAFSPEFTVGDVHGALATLPAERLFPNATKSVRTMVKMMLVSSEPVAPKALKEATSESTYERQTADLEAIDLIERGADGGHGWTISLEPWWARSSSADRPDRHVETDAEGGDGGLRQRSRPTEMLYEIALAMDGEMHLDSVWYGGEGGVRGVDKIAESLPKLAPWIPWVVALVEDVPDERESESAPTVVIGRPPAAATPGQSSLTSATAN